jgi:hypothetical protein
MNDLAVLSRQERPVLGASREDVFSPKVRFVTVEAALLALLEAVQNFPAVF